MLYGFGCLAGLLLEFRGEWEEMVCGEMYESILIGIDRGMLVEGEMLEEGGIELGGEGIAPLGRKESESRLDISSIDILALARYLYYCRTSIESLSRDAVRL
jgi:hypothetical protein